ncbi:phosphatase PAP2 family protein, partial [Aeromicrobium sp.]|uniref:phosphatase PAP2 family protein n=1 Tax=Aeromicrobium sp. TaxID=1871063 RepID=UPI003C4CEBE8
MRRSGLEFSSALAVATVVVAIVMAESLGLGFHDPDGSTGPTYIRLPFIVLVALVLDVVPRALWRARSWRDTRDSAVEVWRERWTPANLRFMLIGLVGWYATYASVRNLKGFVPFANHQLYDTDLARLDRAMFLGHSPAVLLHQLLGTDLAAQALSFFYVAWIAALPASLAIALVWARRDRISSWWVTAVSVDWVIGVALNFALPTLGPIYDRPAEFGGLTTTATTTLQQSMWAERLQVLADPVNTHTVQNIAAFASLHVAIATTACLVAHRAGLHRSIVWSLRAFLAITMVATVYFGWHY